MNNLLAWRAVQNENKPLPLPPLPRNSQIDLRELRCVQNHLGGVSKWYEIQNDGLAQRLFSEHCNSIPRPVAIPGGNWIHCTRWCLSWLAKKLVFEFYKPTYKLHYLNILFILQKMPDNYIRIWTNLFPTFYVLFVGKNTSCNQPAHHSKQHPTSVQSREVPKSSVWHGLYHLESCWAYPPGQTRSYCWRI